ncbi:MAG: MBL fold metallo-hydrolase [Anaerolineales bacterium]
MVDGLIQPAQRSQALLDDIATTQLDPGQMAYWWLGQSGYAFKTASMTWYVDLYLSEHLTHKYANTPKPHIRMTEAPIRGHELREVGLVFSSHKHSDHLDPGTMPDLFEASPSAKLVLPKALVQHAVEMGLDEARLIPTRGDETLTLGALTVHVIPSAHPGLDYDEARGYSFLGFIFQIDGLTIYHSGDTVVYEGLSQRLSAYDLDSVFLPINGTDERRAALNVPPNMDMDDAIQLAQTVNARLLVPHHYDMFTFNTVDVKDFIVKAREAEQAYQVLQTAQKYIYTKG